MTLGLLIAAAVLAVGDWIAVAQRRFRLEYLLKPLALALLVAAAVTADLGVAQPWVVAALACGLAGDIGLMLSKDTAGDGTPDVAFLAGLGAFLAGHVCYAIAFLRTGVRGVDVLAGVLVALGVSALALPRVLRSAAAASGRAFAAVVGGYALLLAVMTVLGVGTGIVATALGAALFLASDTVLAWQRFVRRLRHGDLTVIVTYHAAQFLILIGLLRTL